MEEFSQSTTLDNEYLTFLIWKKILLSICIPDFFAILAIDHNDVKNNVVPAR